MDAIAELNPRSDWFIEQRPFRHIWAERVFRRDAYESLVKAFVAVRDDASQGNDQDRFRGRQVGYDAQMVAMNHRLGVKFAPIFERRWANFTARLLELPVLPQIDGGLHHIPVNSRSGWIHNDFCSAWFDEGLKGDVVFPDRTKCDYFSGTPKSVDARPREYVRSATMIFYLQNDSWQKGSGGETGLYAGSRVDLGPMSAVAPLSNSLLLFECSPHSYHRLIGNPGCARNSIILWLHDSIENAMSKWGNAVTRRKPQ